MRIAVDVDGVLYRGEWLGPAAFDGPPTPGAIDWLTRQMDQGTEIVIHTCRLTGDEPEAVGECIRGWLAGHGLPHPERLTMWTHRGKPHADLYLDDKAHRFRGRFTMDMRG